MYKWLAQKAVLVGFAMNMFDLIAVYAAEAGHMRLAEDMRELRAGIDILIEGTRVGPDRISWLQVLVEFGAALDLPGITQGVGPLAVAATFQVAAVGATAITWTEPARETAAYIDERTGLVLNMTLGGSLYVVGAEGTLQPARDLSAEATQVYFILEHALQDYVGNFTVEPGGAVVMFTLEDAAGETTAYAADVDFGGLTFVTAAGVFAARATVPRTAPPFTLEAHGLISLVLTDAAAASSDAKFATLSMYGGARVNGPQL